MTAASMNVNVVRGMVSTWPGRILVIVLAAVLVGGAVTTMLKAGSETVASPSLAAISMAVYVPASDRGGTP